MSWKVDTRTGPEGWEFLRKSTWENSDAVDNFWTASGQSAGRGVSKIAKKYLSKEIFGFKIGAIVAAISAFASGGSALAAIAAGLKANGGKGVNKFLKQLKLETGPNWLSQYKIPVLKDKSTEDEILALFDAHIKIEYHNRLLFKRLTERLFDNFEYLNNLDFSSTKQAEQTATALLTLKILFENSLDRRNRFMSQTIGRSFWTEPSFIDHQIYSTKYGIDNTNIPQITLREKWLDISNFIAQFEITENQAEVDNFYNSAVANETQAGIGTQKINRDQLMIAAVIAGTGFIFSKVIK